MKVVSLFDGISCGRIALERAGIKVEKYYSSEIDANAIKVSKNNWKDITYLGNVTEINFYELDSVDLLIGGSPCTNLSFAGKKEGMSTNENMTITTLEQYLELKKNNVKFVGQSYLFWEYVRALKELKPKYFLLENVKMPKKWENVITTVLGVKPIEINSSLVSAQNRKRLYWTNIPNITQPEDKKIFIKDILDYNSNNKKYLSKERSDYILKLAGLPRKERILLVKKGIPSKSTPIDIPIYSFIYRNHLGQNGRIFKDKSATLVCASVGCVVDKIDNEKRIRLLTPEECEKLQNIPVGYTAIVSNSNRYKLLGNAWTVDVIVHILKNIK